MAQPGALKGAEDTTLPGLDGIVVMLPVKACVVFVRFFIGRHGIEKNQAAAPAHDGMKSMPVSVPRTHGKALAVSTQITGDTLPGEFVGRHAREDGYEIVQHDIFIFRLEL